MRKLTKYVTLLFFTMLFWGMTTFAAEVIPVSMVLYTTQEAALYADDTLTTLIMPLEADLPIQVTGITDNGLYRVNIADVTYYIPGLWLKQPENVVQSQNATAQQDPALQQVVDIINIERAAAGRKAVVMDEKLNQAAAVRAVEIKQYFEHQRPDGRSCFSVLDEFNIQRRNAGENIAYGYNSPQQVMIGWMNSSGHRENILKPVFGKVGIGHYTDENGRQHWVQLFTN